MVHVHNESVIAVPIDVAWNYICDLRNGGEWVFGVSRLEVVGAIPCGMGTRYDVSIDLGPKTLHSLVEVRWEPPHTLGLRSMRGFVNESTWILAALDADTTALVTDGTYDLPGGIAGRALGKVIEPFIAVLIRRSDVALRGILEHTSNRRSGNCQSPNPSQPR